MLNEPKQQARLPASGFGYREQVPPQESIGQVHRDRVALVRGSADPTRVALTALRDGRRQWQATTGRSALQKRNVVVRLHEVPEARELAYVQQARSGNWLERAQVNLLAHRPRHEAIARTERKRLIRHGQPIQIGSHRGRIDKARGEHRQAELD